MSTLSRFVAWLVVLIGLGGSLAACGGLMVDQKANQPLPSSLLSKIAAIDSTPAAPMMIRIFKQSSELEVWKQSRSGDYRLLKTYAICKWSGDLGPKLKYADLQSPEGFYTITPALMNPYSHYYLAFNTGYPNKFDRAHGRTGDNVMVHGDCKSVGCFAMTDSEIAEIFALARETFKGGNKSFQLEIFPFRMTAANLARYAKDPNLPFWRNIKTGYDLFEITRRPPNWDVCDRRYVFDVTAPGGAVLDPVAACPPLSRPAMLTAALDHRQQADSAAIEAQAAIIDANQQKAAVAANKQAEEQAAVKARGEAIGGFFNSLGAGLFGGQPAAVPAPAPAITAPIPAPALRRS